MQRVRHAAALFALVLCFTLLAVTDARATVVQVDGTIVPQMVAGTSCVSNVQNCLNNAEGVSPPAANSLDAILDASQLPEIFLPNTSAAVRFLDVAEGAGFENSFGYYNVGDDVTNTDNLHPIMGCGVPAGSHPAPANGYVLNAEPGSSTTVDFAAEEAAGRYRGGYIGFYLITPEGHGGSPNCGDFVGSSYFGRIYFTQRDLNNDGDFVHHLVYQSRLATDRFYFGFEDLFRGGDNDFEDMMMQVTGLTPPCVPGLEVCNGRDDDCDGLVDGADPSLSDTGMDCTCDGSGIPCEGGPRQGVCQTGATACVSGGLLCRSTVGPSAETCNGLDDNCDGTVDDSPTDAGAACDGPDADLCDEGALVCSAGTLSCSDTTGANVETCNGVDDDCDGTIDEDVAGLGVACDGPDGDLCQEGVTACSAGRSSAATRPAPRSSSATASTTTATADVDESPTDVGAACSVGVGSLPAERRHGVHDGRADLQRDGGLAERRALQHARRRLRRSDRRDLHARLGLRGARHLRRGRHRVRRRDHDPLLERARRLGRLLHHRDLQRARRRLRRDRRRGADRPRELRQQRRRVLARPAAMPRRGADLRRRRRADARDLQRARRRLRRDGRQFAGRRGRRLRIGRGRVRRGHPGLHRRRAGLHRRGRPRPRGLQRARRRL